MAKFRQGNLILTETEKIIQGGKEVLSSSGVSEFASIEIDGIVITSFDTNINLGSSDNSLPTQNAVKEYVDSKISGSIAPADEYALARYDDNDGIQGSDILIDDSNNITGIQSIHLNIGPSINEFSTDGTFSDDSTSAIPTESAVKEYVDSKISGSIASSTNNALARYDGTDGIKGSGITIDNSDNMSGVETLTTNNLQVIGTTKIEGHFDAGNVAPDGTTRINYDGYLYASKIFNAVWNDIADFQKVDDVIIPGKCYYDTLTGAKICNERHQKAVIGILSDTFGFAIGTPVEEGYGPFAIAGWVLAYVDGNCEIGDPLTSNEYGNLCKMSRYEVEQFPDRIVATYKRPETTDVWGTNQNKIIVNRRHWVKVH